MKESDQKSKGEKENNLTTTVYYDAAYSQF